jgi:hypothetical protein
MQHAVGREYIQTMVNGQQLTINHVPGVRQELCDQLSAVWNKKPPWLTKTFVHTVREI